MKPIIGLDIDGVVCDFTQAVLSVYNYKNICEPGHPFIKNEALVIEDVVDYSIEKFTGIDCFIEIMNIMQAKHACMYLPIYKDARFLFDRLRDIGEVYFITKPFESYKDWYSERNYWLKKHFDCDSSNIIYTSKKYLANVDILIDDCPKFLSEWSEFTNKPAIKVERPWNNSFTADRVYPINNLREIPYLVTDLLGINGK